MTQDQEKLAIIGQFQKELNENLDYNVIALGPDRTLLDGFYTSEELRKIADKMEKLKFTILAMK